MNKVIAYQNVPSLITQLKDDSIVLVGGCFDILHLGHVRFLTQAKNHGVLIVALESDDTLVKFKGEMRPIHKQVERAEVLASLGVVDYILLLPYFSSDDEYFELIQHIHPTTIAVTQGDVQIENKRKQASSVGAQLIEIPKIETPSTTQLAKLLSLE